MSPYAAVIAFPAMHVGIRVADGQVTAITYLPTLHAPVRAAGCAH